MVNDDAGSYLYLRIEPKKIVAFSEFIGVQNKVFEKGFHGLLNEEIRLYRYEGTDEFLLTLSVQQYWLGVIPILEMIPKFIAWGALAASYRFQHKLRGGFKYVPAYKAAHFFLSKIERVV